MTGAHVTAWVRQVPTFSADPNPTPTPTPIQTPMPTRTATSTTATRITSPVRIGTKPEGRSKEYTYGQLLHAPLNEVESILT